MIFLFRSFPTLALAVFFSLLIMGIRGYAQNPLSEAGNIVTLTGTITQPKNILISVDIAENPISGKLLSYASRIDSSGHFTIQLPLKSPTLAWFFHANSSVPIFLFPGDNLQISVNALDLVNTVKFEGRGAENCRLITNYYRKFTTATQRSIITQKMSDLEPEAFIAYANDIRKQKLQLLADYKVKGSIASICDSFVKAQIDAEWANALIDYPFAHSLKSDELSPSNLPPDYYNFMNEVDLQNNEVMQLTVYTDYLLKYVSNRFTKIYSRAGSNPDNFYADKFEFAKQLLSGKALYYVQGMCIADACTYSKVENIAPKFDQYLITCPYTDYTQAVTEVYDKAFRVAAGQKAPDFTLTNLAGDTVSLSQLKGKVLYVDFWATWCGPCIRELPYAEQLKNKFKDREVAFVYISVDDNPMEWENFLNTKLHSPPDSALHLFANGLSSETGKLYNIKGVPRYLIIDANNIITDSNAKRPSDPGITTDIEKALARRPQEANN